MTNLKRQKTIKTEIKLSGKGLFSGQDVKVVFRPADENTGVVFVRTDTPDPVTIPATVKYIADRDRRTALGINGVFVETPEHCLAAVNALGIDNIIIELDNYELPGFDGSAAEYFRALKKAGLLEQTSPRKVFKITEPISITDGDTAIYALPYNDSTLNITYDLDYTQHTGIGRQFYSCQFSEELFERDLSTARTFCLEAEARQMQAAGIGTHLSPKEVLVINSDGPIKNTYRFPNECVRHKVVDLIGDLLLVGTPVIGRIVAYKSGHAINRQLAEAIVKAISGSDKKSKADTEVLLDIRRIQRILPHRYPFLLVDKVIHVEDGQKITGVKNVTYNEQFFQGHFPGTPIMPGVMIVEALAQVSGLLFSQKLEHTGKLAVLLSMDRVKIRKPVVPGDQLLLCAESIRVRDKIAKCSCVAKVGADIAAEAMLTFMLVDDDVV